MSDERRRKVKEKVAEELKRFIVIAAYLWVLFSVFEVHRFAVLKEFNLTSISGYRIGFALINALIMGKIFLLGETLHVGERLGTERLINSVLFKSAMFALFLVCFQSVEELTVGLIHGKAVAGSIPGGFERKLIEGTLAFVVLIPFFMYTEVRRVLGTERVHSLILEKRPKRDAA